MRKKFIPTPKLGIRESNEQFATRVEKDKAFSHSKTKKPTHSPRDYSDPNPLTPYQLGRASVFTMKGNPFSSGGETPDHIKCNQWDEGFIATVNALSRIGQSL